MKKDIKSELDMCCGHNDKKDAKKSIDKTDSRSVDETVGNQSEASIVNNVAAEKARKIKMGIAKRANSYAEDNNSDHDRVEVDPTEDNQVLDEEIERIAKIVRENKDRFQKTNPYMWPASVVLAAVLIGSAWVYDTRVTYMRNMVEMEQSKSQPVAEAPKSDEISEAQLLASLQAISSAKLPEWGDLGAQMVAAGVIDADKYTNLYTQRGLVDEVNKYLVDRPGELEINAANAQILLNLYWALGIGNQNSILTDGEMTSEQYGSDAGKFASTGGWSLSKGATMDHYSKHNFIALTSEQHALVEEVSKNIYRPCCGNSTHFPDCNHGMAMLGMLEHMAGQGAGEEEMYKAALAANIAWFPQQYLTIAKYQAKTGQKLDAKTILGGQYSSSAGYNNVLAAVEPVQTQGGGGCGV